jgi:hypothetical protein
MTNYYLLLEKKRVNIRWLVFIFLLFACGTTNICVNANYAQKAFIDDRDYPGGPLAYITKQAASSIGTAADALTSFGALLAQTLLVCL